MMLGDFNQAARPSAIDTLLRCIDVQRWAEALADGRPYPDRAALLAHAATAAEPLTPGEVTAALGRHPRIGERAGERGGERGGAATNHRSRAEAAMSRAEQGGVDNAPDETAAAIRRGNLDYENRFGRVFLIRAAGRSAGEILEQLTLRLGNTPEQEDQIVAEQLREIALLRLAGIIDEGGATP